jgi:D-alanyl-D-alanine carboxypeptidase
MRLFFLILLFSSVACSKNYKSIYSNIPENGDGVVDAVIPEGETDQDEEINNIPQPRDMIANKLTTSEEQVVQKYYKGNEAKFSFLVADAEQDKIMRSYFSNQKRKLASVTKIHTALAALETVSGVDVAKVKAMLKSSNNAEASRYARLSAKAIANYTTTGAAYSETHSCPSSKFKNDAPAADIIHSWLEESIQTDWQGSMLKDGAGCDYGNVMSALQVTKVLQHADGQGAAYAGQSFEKLLSISGVDGTWAGYNKDAKGMVLAKTGTLTPTSNLAGYFYAKRNGQMKKYYFALLVDKGTSDSSAEARLFIEAMVRHWISYYSLQEGAPLASF